MTLCEKERPYFLIEDILHQEISNIRPMPVSGVTRYLEFKSIEGSYVMGKSGKISKVECHKQQSAAE